jgi:hypothetical protein
MILSITSLGMSPDVGKYIEFLHNFVIISSLNTMIVLVQYFILTGLDANTAVGTFSRKYCVMHSANGGL